MTVIRVVRNFVVGFVEGVAYTLRSAARGLGK